MSLENITKPNVFDIYANNLYVENSIYADVPVSSIESTGTIGFLHDNSVNIGVKDIELTDLQNIGLGAGNNEFLRHNAGVVSFASVPSVPPGSLNQILRHNGTNFAADDKIVNSNLPDDINITNSITGATLSGILQPDDVDASAANIGDVLTVDGTNTAVWAPPSGGLPAGSANDVLVHNGVSYISQPQITMGNIPINSIDNPKLQSNSVSTVKIQDNAVSTIKIQDDAVNGDKIADLSVDTQHIVDGAVTEVKIGSGAVTEDKIDTDAVTTVKLLDGAVNQDKLATDSVSTIKIQNGAVETAKINDSAVTTAKINDNAITTAKILNANVTPAKISPGVNGQVLQTVGGVAAWNTYSVESYFATTGGAPQAAPALSRITYSDPSILNPLGLSNIGGVISGFNAAKFYLVRFKCQVNSFTNGDNMTIVLRQESAPNNIYDTYSNSVVMVLAGTANFTCELTALVDGSALPAGISAYVSAKSGSMTVSNPRLTIRMVN